MTGKTGITELESRYRRALRLLPASYRERREEEMVDAFCESMRPTRDRDRSEAAAAIDDDDREVPLPELASLVGLAVRVRLGGAGATARSVSWGEAVRLVALLGLFYHAAFTLQTLVSNAVSATVAVPGLRSMLVPDDPAMLVTQLCGLAWLPAFLTLIAGRRRLARWCVLPALVPAVSGMASGLFELGATGPDLSPLVHMVQMPVTVLPVLALYAGYHRDAPAPAHRRRWLLALPVVAVTSAGVQLAMFVPPAGATAPAPEWSWLFAGDYAVLALLTGLGCLIAHRSAPWLLAMALLLVPAALARVLVSVDPTTLIQAAAFVALAGVLAVLGVRRLPVNPPTARRLPGPGGGHP